MQKIRFVGVIFFAMAIFLVACCSSLQNPKGPPQGKIEWTYKPIYTGIPLRTIPIWVDKSFADYDDRAIERAVATWNRSLNGYIKLEIVDETFTLDDPDKVAKRVSTNGWIILKIDSNAHGIPDTEKGYEIIGYSDKLGGNYVFIVRDRINYWDVYGLTMHEMGHLLGSDHVGIRLMFRHFDVDRCQCPDWDTVYAVASWRRLPVGAFNYCTDNNGAPVFAGDIFK